MDDLISRQDVLDYIDTMPSELTSDGRRMIRRVTLTEYIADTLPSAEREEFEWCHDCKEYDQEQHCCHRWTKVIRNTVGELKQTAWIPCSERLPQTNVSILYCKANGTVGEGRYEGWNGYHFVWKMYAICGTDWDDEVIAWMPLPEPYKGETE